MDGAKEQRSGERRSNRWTERRSDGATEQQSNRATERQIDGATERQNDKATEQQNKDFAMIKLLAQNPRQQGSCAGIFSCPYCQIFGELLRVRRRLWCPWRCVGWYVVQMTMKLLSGISAILVVSY